MLVYFALGDASFSRFYPTANLKFALPPTPIPDASQWNIGGVVSWRWVFALGMYISYFFVLISCPTQTRFSVEYGLKVSIYAGIMQESIWSTGKCKVALRLF